MHDTCLHCMMSLKSSNYKLVHYNRLNNNEWDILARSYVSPLVLMKCSLVRMDSSAGVGLSVKTN